MRKKKILLVLIIFLFFIPILVIASNPPFVTLEHPEANLRDNDGNIAFKCNATDDEKLVNISLYHNISSVWQLNQTQNISGVANYTYFSVSNILNNTYSWNCQAIDNESLSIFSNFNFTFTIGALPHTYLDYPLTQTSDSIGNFSFNCSVEDTYNLVNISLYHNMSGIWQLNQTRTISGTSNFSVFNLVDIPDGDYIWNCLAYDNESQLDWGSSNRSFREGIDSDTPSVILTSPINSTTNYEGQVLFDFNASDISSGITNCSLYFNNTLNTTSSSISEYSSNYFLVSGLTNSDYLWRIECTDLSTESNKGYSENRVVSVIDLTAPVISIDEPQNNTIDLNGDVTFSYGVFDDGYGVDNCSLFINGALNQTNNFITISWENKFDVREITNGNYNWYIYCIDKSPNRNENMSVERSFVVNIETIAPNLTLISPNTIDTDGNITFKYIVVDLNSSISHCDLYINNIFNQSNTNITENSVETFNIYNLVESGYNWYINCFDNTLYQTRNKSDTWNFSVIYDRAPPTINLLYPQDRATITHTKYVNFIYNVNDASDISNCSLIINGSRNVTLTNISKGVTQHLTTTGPLYNGEYSWNISCTDNSDTPNTGSSITRVVVMDTKPNVTLNTSPLTTFSDGTFNLTYIVNDDDILRNCSLYHNISIARGWVSNLTNTFVQRNIPINFLVKNIPDDTIFVWNILCYDKDYYTSWSGANRTVVINNTPPVLTGNFSPLVWDEDNYTVINLSMNFMDIDGDKISYTSTPPPTVSVEINNLTGIAQLYSNKNWFGLTNVTFTAYDDTENTTSEPVTIVVNKIGDTAPKIYQNPQNNALDTDGYLFLSCNVSDDYNVVNISLYTNISGNWQLNQSQQTFGDESTITFNITELSDGSYKWNCLAHDDNGNYSWGENRSVDVGIMADISSDIPRFMVNNVNISSYVLIGYSGFLNNTLNLGNLTIYESDGDVYFNENISNSSRYISDAFTILPKLINITPNDIFDENFTINNSEMLNITLDYYYQGKSYKTFTNTTIKIKECWWCD